MSPMTRMTSLKFEEGSVVTISLWEEGLLVKVSSVALYIWKLTLLLGEVFFLLVFCKVDISSYTKRH